MFGYSLEFSLTYKYGVVFPWF